MKEILIIIFVPISQNNIFIFQKCFITTECYKNPLFGIEPDQRKLQVFLVLCKVGFLISIHTSHLLFISDNRGHGLSWGCQASKLSESSLQSVSGSLV